MCNPGSPEYADGDSNRQHSKEKTTIPFVIVELKASEFSEIMKIQKGYIYPNKKYNLK